MEKRLRHRDEADQFYGSLGAPVRVGMEARGHELWLGDAAKIRAGVVRKQKTDRRDAEQILRLLIEDRFPKIWTPSLAERDARQLLVHRHKQVVRRTQVKPIGKRWRSLAGAEEMEAVNGGRTRAGGAIRTATLRCPATSASASNAW